MARNSVGDANSPQSGTPRSSSSPITQRAEGSSNTISPASSESFRTPLKSLSNKKKTNISIPAKRKSYDSEDQNPENQAKLLKLFVGLGVELKDVASNIVEEFCLSTWGLDFAIPTVEEFSTTLFEKARNEYFQELLLEGIYEFIYVYTVDGKDLGKDGLYVISFGVTQKNRLLYIFDGAISSGQKNNWSNILQKFCDESVRLLFQRYNRKAKFVMHNSNLSLNNVGRK